MGRIHKLSATLVNKIAAGEVVERPASVAKELVENALDAGARRIEVTVEGAGSRLLRIVDDGQGIAAEDLPLAVASHATSKIRTADDLFRILSLGFRGEALASIAAVSHLRLASRAAGASQGAELEIDGGRARPVRPAGLPPGTCVEVGDLFFNVPARRAFLKTERAELRAVLNELKRQALCRPEVHLRVTGEGKTLLEAPATDEPRERIAQLLGRELAQDLLAVPEVEAGGVRVRGYASPCDRSRGDSQQQFFFLNGRCVRDVTLMTAVKSAYGNLLPPRRHPTLLLWLELDPREVDVNVHPQKAEVRFTQGREVFRLVVRAIQGALRTSGLVRELPLSRHHGLEGAGVGGSPFGGGPQQEERALPHAAPWFAAGRDAAAREAAGTALLALPPGVQGAVQGLEAGPLDRRASNSATGPGLGRYLQVHRRYVVEETPGGLRLVDPHALHERILYEEIRARLVQQPLESQRFLFPQVIEVEPDELLALPERGVALEQLGFEVAPFGRNALAVHAAPRLLAGERVAEAVRRLLRELDPAEDLHGAEGDGENGAFAVEAPGGPDAKLLHELAAALACRAAVRFGEALSDEQIEALLRRRAEVPRGHCCPHGRPTSMALSLDELDRRFGRQGLDNRDPKT